MHIFDDLFYNTNKGARDLYDFLKVKYTNKFKSVEDVRIFDEYTQDFDYLADEIDKFLINICQDIYDNKDKVKEILDKWVISF